jgi:hypothetical protein
MLILFLYRLHIIILITFILEFCDLCVLMLRKSVNHERLVIQWKGLSTSQTFEHPNLFILCDKVC